MFSDFIMRGKKLMWAAENRCPAGSGSGGVERELGRRMTDWQRTKHGRARVGVNKESKWREAIASGRLSL